MLPPGFKDKLTKLSDEDVMDILEAASEEVKRRSGISGLGIGDIRNNSVENNLKILLDSLQGLGVKINQNIK